MKKLIKACSKYEKWKAKHQPSFKPWLYPEQMNPKRLNPEDIGTFSAQETLIASANSGEATIRENSVQIDAFVKED
jgi:hypothetical protein